MDRHLDDLQRIHQAFQPVRQGDGRGGVGQQEGRGDQHQNTHQHKGRTLRAAGGDGNAPEIHQHPAVLVKKQIQHAGENKDHHQRLHAPDDGFSRNGGNFDYCQQEQEQHAVGYPPGGNEKRHHVYDQNNELRSGVEAVNDGIAREILAEGNVFKHGSFPP